MLRSFKNTMSFIVFLVLGLLTLSLWLVSLISVTLCFVELGLSVFHQIINFVDKCLSEKDRIGEIIEHKYMQYLLIFLQSPISLIGPIGSLAFGLVILHLACCACWHFCAICTVVHYSSERTYAFFFRWNRYEKPVILGQN